MKININKMQYGGSAPFTYFQPVLTNPGKAGSSSQSYSGYKSNTKNKTDDDDEDTFMKEISSLLKEIDALPSDAESIFKATEQLLKLEKNGFIGNDTLNVYYNNILHQIHNAKFNKQQFDLATQRASKKSSLYEFAVTPNGGVFVIDLKTNQSKLINVESYLNNKNKYQLQTVADMLSIRAYEKAGMNDIFRIVDSSTSSKEIDSLLDAYIGDLKNDSNDTSWPEYKKSADVIKGVSALQDMTQEQIKNASSPSGLYNIRHSITSNELVANNAIKYLYTMLPENAKTLLKLKHGSTSGAMEAIGLYVGMNRSTNEVLEYDYQETKNSKEKSNGDYKGSSGYDADHFSGQHMNMIKGDGGNPSKFNLLSSDGKSFSIDSIKYTILEKDSKKPIQPNSNFEEIFNSDLHGIYSGGVITFGSKIIEPGTDLRYMAYLNNGAHRVWLPTKNTEKGTVPDLDFLESKEGAEIVKIVNESGSIDSPEAQKALIKAGLINPETGNINTNRWKVFFAIDAIADSDFADKSDHVTEIKREDPKYNEYIDLFNRAVNKSYDKDKKNVIAEIDKNDWEYYTFGIFGHKKYYKGTVYIPATSSIIQGSASDGINIKQDLIEKLSAAEQAFERRKNMGITESSALGL